MAPDRKSSARRPEQHRDEQVGQARSSAILLLSDGDIMGFNSPGQSTHKPPQLAAASASWGLGWVGTPVGGASGGVLPLGAEKEGELQFGQHKCSLVTNSAISAKC